MLRDRIAISHVRYGRPNLLCTSIAIINRLLYMSTSTNFLNTPRTIVEFVSADGQKMPPCTVFKGSMPHTAYDRMGLPTAGYTCTETGNVNDKVFAYCLKNFVKYVRGEAPIEGKFLLLMDNHSPHLSEIVRNVCLEDDIDILTFPSHCQIGSTRTPRTRAKRSSSAKCGRSALQRHPSRSASILGTFLPLLIININEYLIQGGEETIALNMTIARSPMTSSTASASRQSYLKS